MSFSSGGFQLEVFNSIREVEMRWDQFHATQKHIHSTYLSALERCNPPDMEFRYVLVSKDEQVVACAYLQIVNYSGRNFSENGSAFLLASLKLFFKLKKVRLLFCGNLFRVDFPCLHFLENKISLEQIVDLVQEIRVAEKCQLLMIKEMDCTSEELAMLEQHGFRKYAEDMTMSLALKSKWNSFEDYFNSITKKYKKRLKLIRQAKDKFEVRNLSTSEIKNFLPRIAELFNAIISKQFLRMGIVDENYFVEMRNTFGEKFFINGYFINNKMVAFASHINHSEMLEVHYIGIDYTFNEEFFLYFNILYDGVEQAILMKKKFLDLGRTAREAKASVGCKPVPSNDYLFVKSRFVKFLINVFEKLFLNKMGDEWLRRNPFKKEGIG